MFGSWVGDLEGGEDGVWVGDGLLVGVRGSDVDGGSGRVCVHVGCESGDLELVWASGLPRVES